MNDQYRRILDDLKAKWQHGQWRKQPDQWLVQLATPQHISLIIAAALAIVTVFGWLSSGRLIVHQSYWLLTLPLFLYLFLLRTDKDEPSLYKRQDLRSALIGACGFIFALLTGGPILTLSLATGIGGTMFAFIDYDGFQRLLRRYSRLAAAAAIGALSGWLYFLSQVFSWKLLAAATANCVYFLLYNFIPQMTVFAKGHRQPVAPGAAPAPHPHPAAPHAFHRMVPVRIPTRAAAPPMPHPHGPLSQPPAVAHPLPDDFMAVASSHFTLRIAGLENIGAGLCIFLFALALECMVSGREVKPKRLAAIVFGGLALMFVLNTLFMTLYFYFCDMALTPGASSGSLQVAKIIYTLVNEPIVSILGYVAAALLLVRLFFPSPALFAAVRKAQLIKKRR